MRLRRTRANRSLMNACGTGWRSSRSASVVSVAYSSTSPGTPRLRTALSSMDSTADASCGPGGEDAVAWSDGEGGLTAEPRPLGDRDDALRALDASLEGGLPQSLLMLLLAREEEEEIETERERTTDQEDRPHEEPRQRHQEAR